MGMRTAGVDVGGTKILGVAYDNDSGELLTRCQVPTPKREAGADPDALRAALFDTVEQLISEVGTVDAVGLGLPGLVGFDGVLRYGPNVAGYTNVTAAADIGEQFGVPVTAGNDGSWAALAEHRMGAARGTTDAVVVTQGTGIGAGLIVGGQLARGAHGFAGEPGHMAIRDYGPTCACGNIGCWESTASGAGLTNFAVELYGEGRARELAAAAGGDPHQVRGEHVGLALAAGDPDAVELLSRFAVWVGRGVASLISILDPHVVVLGGGLCQLSDHFIANVGDEANRRALGWGFRPVVPVVPAELGPEAGAIGAALGASDELDRG